jgi:hypothetical protein
MTARSVAQREAAAAAQARADDARERALAARAAAQRATTEYARHTYHRVADLHTWTALRQDECARALRFGAHDAARE